MKIHIEEILPYWMLNGICELEEGSNMECSKAP